MTADAAAEMSPATLRNSALSKQRPVACLTAVEPMTPEEIRSIREREHVSQPVFARYLNVSKGLVSDWERGVKKPSGPALRLLTVVQKKGLEAIA